MTHGPFSNTSRENASMTPPLFDNRIKAFRRKQLSEEERTARLQKKLEEFYGTDKVRNFLDQVPVIKAEWVEKDGIVGILKNRFRSERTKRFGKLLGLAPSYYERISNKYGAFIWKHIDGKRTVRKIGVKLFAEFSDDETLSYQRIKLFMDMLEEREHIIYVNPLETEEEGKAEGAEGNESGKDEGKAEETDGKLSGKEEERTGSEAEGT